MEKTKREWIKYKVEHYRGTLDFPCDFCNSNSYDNIHISKNERIFVVICKDCIAKVLKEDSS